MSQPDEPLPPAVDVVSPSSSSDGDEEESFLKDERHGEIDGVSPSAATAAATAGGRAHGIIDRRKGISSAAGDVKKRVKCHVVVTLFALVMTQGVGAIISYNSYVSTPQFMINCYGSTFMVYFSFAFILPNLVFSFLYTAFAALCGGLALFIVILFASYLVAIALLVAFPYLSYLEDCSAVKEVKSSRGVILALVVGALSGVCTAGIQTGIFAWVYSFHELNVVAVSVGYSFCGPVISGIALLTTWTIPDMRHSAITYFTICAVLTSLCFVCFLILWCWTLGLKCDQVASTQDSSTPESPSAAEREKVSACDRIRRWIKCMKDQFMAVWYNALSICALFLVTLAIFPGISSLIPKSGSKEGLWATRYENVVMSWTFMLGDFFGRMAPLVDECRNCCTPLKFIYFCKEDRDDATCWNIVKVVSIMCRFAFWSLFPMLFMLGQEWQYLDAIGILLMLVLATSNGFFCTTLMQDGKYHAEERIRANYREWGADEQPLEREIRDSRGQAGALMTAFMMLGITFGSGFSFVILNLMKLIAKTLPQG